MSYEKKRIKIGPWNFIFFVSLLLVVSHSSKKRKRRMRKTSPSDREGGKKRGRNFSVCRNAQCQILNLEGVVESMLRSICFWQHKFHYEIPFSSIGVIESSSTLLWSGSSFIHLLSCVADFLLAFFNRF